MARSLAFSLCVKKEIEIDYKRGDSDEIRLRSEAKRTRLSFATTKFSKDWLATLSHKAFSQSS